MTRLHWIGGVIIGLTYLKSRDYWLRFGANQERQSAISMAQDLTQNPPRIGSSECENQHLGDSAVDLSSSRST
jgi:hypothetical protein